MKISETLTTSMLAIVLGLLLMGCGAKHSHHAHDEDAEHAEHGDHDDRGETRSGGGDDHGHGADAESFSGAIHKEGKGITLLPQTKERLGIKLEEVREEKLPLEIAFTARVFAAEPSGVREASGILPAAKARDLKEGSTVNLQLSEGPSLQGLVVQSTSPVSTNETETIVRFKAPDSAAGIGSFVRVSAALASESAVPTIPKEALIKGTTETFVYVQNEDAYLRTVVTPGRETRDSVEIRDGLFEGDSVVTKGAMDLWLVELRAVKGGQGCCPAPPVKGKAN